MVATAAAAAADSDDDERKDESSAGNERSCQNLTLSVKLDMLTCVSGPPTHALRELQPLST